jgi:hypothetical protein
MYAANALLFFQTLEKLHIKIPMFGNPHPFFQIPEKISSISPNPKTRAFVLSRGWKRSAGLLPDAGTFMM